MKNIHDSFLKSTLTSCENIKLRVKEEEELLWLRRPNVLYIIHGTNSAAAWRTLTLLWIITGFNF